ncbi:MAG: UDP-N-acetylmuramate--L-alanine ligase, partial [Bacteroidetes bacterium]
MNFENIKYIYFLGIGGIGMSALARYCKAMGKSVSGYDKTRTALTDELVAEGIAVHYEDNVDLISSELRTPGSGLLVVWTPAIPMDHSELKYFQKNN